MFGVMAEALKIENLIKKRRRRRSAWMRCLYKYNFVCGNGLSGGNMEGEDGELLVAVQHERLSYYSHGAVILYCNRDLLLNTKLPLRNKNTIMSNNTSE